MAEDEIRKHAKAALKAMKEPNTDWKHKLKDVILEILIIVFAVTVSIWFHNWSDERHDRAQEQQFLAGYRTDLAGDVVNIQNSIDFYQKSFKGMQYFAQVGKGDSLNNDSLKKYGNIFLGSTVLGAHTNRYEALKSSGRLGIIEDQELLNNIIELNESTFSHIQLLNDMYFKFTEKASDYLQQNVQLTPDGRFANAAQILRNSQWRLLMTYGQSILIQNILPAQTEGLKECRALIQEIDSGNK